MRRTFIIAEAGVNHNGDMRLARRLVTAASRAGADAVKFQTFRAEQLVSVFAPKADYQRRTTDARESQFAMIKQLELGWNDHRRLLQYAVSRGIRFLSTPFDEESADLLERLGVSLFKIPSGEITNHPFLRHVARKRKPMIVSTGMSSLAEVGAAVNVIRSAGNRRITLLQCVTAYPAPMRDVNLRAMETMRRAFGLDVGYSDHTTGIEAPIAAVALGASVIEKHFTIDRALPGPDHKASLEPAELAAMVSAIRNVELALGDGVKRMMPCERRNARVARKSLVAAVPIARGEPFTRHNVARKRPGTGISPARLGSVIGRRARRSFRKDELIVL